MSDTPERQRMDADIVCVGFGPATGGFLTTLSRGLMNPDGTPAAESKVMPGMPPQVLCYERADDIGFGVSGVVTKARAIRESFPDLTTNEGAAAIPMCCPMSDEETVYLFDPHGAARKSAGMKLLETLLKPLRKNHAAKLPYTPAFLKKHPGLVMSIGQFNQWVGANLMGSGLVQIWPGTPVAGALIEGQGDEARVTGIRLADQGVDKQGNPEAGYMPGMDVGAALTVIGDGPVGPVGRGLDEALGLPQGHHKREWAVGMKMVVDLPQGCGLKPGAVIHTLGYPEPEIFGFFYVYPDNVASLGIFVPSWFDSPVRTAYRYLQHWMLHPYLWKHLEGATLRSWGAKSLDESGKRGEPRLCGHGFARIGEGSGSTNVLTGSGVDEAWATGVQLGEAVLELMRSGSDFSRENLEAAYVVRRRGSWVEQEAKVAEKARDGFTKGVFRGLMGMALSGLTKGKLNGSADSKPVWKRIPSPEEYFKGRIPADEIKTIRAECTAKGASLHQALMDRVGWPSIPFDGKLLVSHQDALLMGGKVQAAPGFADHVRFTDPEACARCAAKVCVEACSGQAITINPDGPVPLFDREKCVHCGACLWNCSQADARDPERTNVEFKAGSGGLHSAEN